MICSPWKFRKGSKPKNFWKCNYIFTSVFAPPNAHAINIQTESNTVVFSSFMPQYIGLPKNQSNKLKTNPLK